MIFFDSRQQIDWNSSRVATYMDLCTLLKRRENAIAHNGEIHWKEDTMKDLVTYIARSLVDKPDQVSVAEVEGNQTTGRRNPAIARDRLVGIYSRHLAGLSMGFDGNSICQTTCFT